MPEFFKEYRNENGPAIETPNDAGVGDILTQLDFPPNNIRIVGMNVSLAYAKDKLSGGAKES